MERKDSVTSLDTSAAATYLGCSIALMELMRREGRGPKFYKCGKRLVRYRPVDLEEWMQANVVKRHNTTGEVRTVNKGSKELELENKRAERLTASGAGLCAHAAATAIPSVAVNRISENVTHVARASASSEDSDHICCANFAALQTRRIEALAALAHDPILPSQTNVLPSQDKLLREISHINLTLRSHALQCGNCAAIWYAARLHNGSHMSQVETQTARDQGGVR